jgi:hypothetical protein
MVSIQMYRLLARAKSFFLFYYRSSCACIKPSRNKDFRLALMRGICPDGASPKQRKMTIEIVSAPCLRVQVLVARARPIAIHFCK